MKSNDVRVALNLLLSIIAEVYSPTFGVYRRDAVDYFQQKIQDVLSGRVGHAGNPLGYFVIGLSPNSKRGQQLVADQFRYALSRGYTSKAHVECRSLEGTDTESSLKQGMIWASPKRDSRALGSAEGRVVGHAVSYKARAGVQVASLAERLNALIKGGDAATASRELPMLYQEAQAANDLTLQAYMSQVWEALPDCNATVTLADVAKATAVRRNKK